MLLMLGGIYMLSSMGLAQQPFLPSPRKTTPYVFRNDSLSISLEAGTLLIHALHPNALQVVYQPDSLVNPPSNALAGTGIVHRHCATLTDRRGVLTLSTDSMRAVFDKNTEQLRVYYKNRRLTDEIRRFAGDSLRGFEFKITEKEQLTGGGERVLGVNRRGQRLLLYNRPSYGYETKADVMYYSLPVFISDKKYGVIFDNGAKGWLDLDHDNTNRVRFSAVGGRMSYIIIAAGNWPSYSKAQAEVCGYQPLVPRWLLGNISSRMGYHSQGQVEEVVRRFHTGQVPLDAVVLDLYWFGKTLKGTLGAMQWYKDSFPDGPGMIRRLGQQGVKTILISEPFILKNSRTYDEVIRLGIEGKTKEGCPYLFDFYFGNTVLLDIFNPGAKTWLWSFYRKYTDQGVAGWWGDLGEPEVHPGDLYHCNGIAGEVHNLFGHEWAKTIFEGYRRDYPLRRPVILMRSGFVGTQRYGIIPWSGDVNRTWGGLQSQVEIATTMSLMGLPYMHSDLGGFAGNYKDAELYTRWLQYGVFQPVFRTHAQEEVPPECIYWDQQTLDIARRFIRLRYALLPYIYTLAFKNSIEGSPLMRPLFYQENDPALFNRTDSYYWGDHFLVRPIIRPGIDEVSIDLPSGTWIDFWTEEVFAGGQTVERPVDIRTIPVFVRAGAFIPMVDPTTNTDNYTSRKLYLHYYNDASVQTAADSMYEDDGYLYDAYHKGRYEMVHFRYFKKKGGRSFLLSKSGNGYKSSSRDVSLIIHHLEYLPVSVRVDHQRIDNYTYDKTNQKLTIPVKWTDKRVNVEIHLND